MSFDKFQTLARVVFPTLPSEFDQMPDEPATYKFVLDFCSAQDYDWVDLDDYERANLFSLNHWCHTAIYNAQIQADRSS